MNGPYCYCSAFSVEVNRALSMSAAAAAKKTADAAAAAKRNRRNPNMSTQICSFFLRGACRFGNRCWYSHNCTPSENGTTSVQQGETMGLKTDTEREQSTSSIDDKRHEDKPSTSSTDYKYDDGPSTSSTISKSQQDTAKEKTIQSADKAGNMDDKSSANELIKSTDKNANKTSEIENAQLVRYTLDRSENDGWRQILNASVSENLHCDICMEIFIKPTVLGCSHMFCGTCISIWARKVNKCPICRSDIESASYCLAIDTFIDKIIDLLPMEVKVKREEAMEDRDELDINLYNNKFLPSADENEESNLDDFQMDIINTTVIEPEEIPNPIMDYLALSNNDDSEDDSDEFDGGLMPGDVEEMRMNLRELAEQTAQLGTVDRYPNQNFFRWL